MVTSLVGAAAFRSTASATTLQPAGLHRSRFVPWVGASFDLSRQGVRSTARLDAIEDLRAGDAGDELAFSLLFRPLTGPEAEAGLHSVSTAGLDPVSLFLSPVDHGRALRLQAVVNQRIPH
jgi:hypothetical protein